MNKYEIVVTDQFNNRATQAYDGVSHFKVNKNGDLMIYLEHSKRPHAAYAKGTWVGITVK